MSIALKRLTNYFNLNQHYVSQIIGFMFVVVIVVVFLDKIVNSVSTTKTIVDMCRYETGGVGVACVIDNGSTYM